MEDAGIKKNSMGDGKDKKERCVQVQKKEEICDALQLN